MEPYRPSHDEAPLRGIQILRTAYLINLTISIVAGALRAHFMDRMLHQNMAVSQVAPSLGVIASIWQAVTFVTSLMLLFGLDGLSKAPKEARLGRIPTFAQVMIGVALVLRIGGTSVTRSLIGGVGSVQIGIIYAGLGVIEALIDLGGFLLVCEALLRLRRYASNNDRALEGSEGLVYGGMVTAVIMRTLSSYTASIVSVLGFAFGGRTGAEWSGYFLRLPFSIAICGLLIWLLGSTEKLLREHRAALAKVHA